MKHIFLILFGFITVLCAEHNASEAKKSWLDEYHRFFTQKIHNFSYHLDEKLSSYDTLIETNTTKAFYKGTTTYNSTTDGALNDWFSSFFKDAIFDEAYTKSYAWLRTTLKYDHKRRKFSPSAVFRASITLPKTRDRLSLYIEETSDEYLSVNNHYDNTLVDGTIGLRYTMPKNRYFYSYLSAGLHRFENPFVLAHGWIPYRVGSWSNRISQTLKYSDTYRFEEETRLYFDRALDDDAMFRINLGRTSRENVEGMKYYSAFAYNKTTKYNRGYQVGVSLEGETKPENEVTKYALYGIYKQNFYRKWLFYEIQPRVEWEKVYDFDPNYVMLVSLEIFFGL